MRPEVTLILHGDLYCASIEDNSVEYPIHRRKVLYSTVGAGIFGSTGRAVAESRDGPGRTSVYDEDDIEPIIGTLQTSGTRRNGAVRVSSGEWTAESNLQLIPPNGDKDITNGFGATSDALVSTGSKYTFRTKFRSSSTIDPATATTIIDRFLNVVAYFDDNNILNEINVQCISAASNFDARVRFNFVRDGRLVEQLVGKIQDQIFDGEIHEIFAVVDNDAPRLELYFDGDQIARTNTTPGFTVNKTGALGTGSLVDSEPFYILNSFDLLTDAVAPNDAFGSATATSSLPLTFNSSFQNKNENKMILDEGQQSLSDIHEQIRNQVDATADLTVGYTDPVLYQFSRRSENPSKLIIQTPVIDFIDDIQAKVEAGNLDIRTGKQIYERIRCEQDLVEQTLANLSSNSTDAPRQNRTLVGASGDSVATEPATGVNFELLKGLVALLVTLLVIGRLAKLALRGGQVSSRAITKLGVYDLAVDKLFNGFPIGTRIGGFIRDLSDLVDTITEFVIEKTRSPSEIRNALDRAIATILGPLEGIINSVSAGEIIAIFNDFASDLDDVSQEEDLPGTLGEARRETDKFRNDIEAEYIELVENDGLSIFAALEAYSEELADISLQRAKTIGGAARAATNASLALVDLVTDLAVVGTAFEAQRDLIDTHDTAVNSILESDTQ